MRDIKKKKAKSLLLFQKTYFFLSFIEFFYKNEKFNKNKNLHQIFNSRLKISLNYQQFDHSKHV